MIIPDRKYYDCVDCAKPVLLVECQPATAGPGQLDGNSAVIYRCSTKHVVLGCRNPTGVLKATTFAATVPCVN